MTVTPSSPAPAASAGTGTGPGTLPHIVVATPCFGGQVSSIYTTSLLKLQQVALSRGIASIEVQLLGGDALITRARANLVTLFLDNPRATHLLFIDADLAFEPDQVFRLLGFGADVTAAAYPVKKIDWAKVRRVIEAKLPNPEATSLTYVVDFEDASRVAIHNGFARARYVGTGFLMIRRQALLALCQHHPELKFRVQHANPDPLAGSPHRYALFDTMIDPDTGMYLSEDYSFCRRWTDMGGEIWVDLESRLVHVGPLAFPGELATQFNAAAPPAAKA